jgi:hypothetical protein
MVTFPDGSPAAGAVISDCDPAYKRILEATKTDSNGRFSFPNAKLGSKHYIKVRFPACQELHLPVKIWPFAKADLSIKLINST